MKKRMWKNALFHILIILTGLSMVYPLLWMLRSSFSDRTKMFSSVSLWPDPIVLSNYAEGWRGLSGITFSTFFLNSFLIVLLVMAGTVFSSILAGYAFARVKFRMRGFWFTIMMGTMMLPLHVKLVPQYIVFYKLGWVNTFLPLAVPSFFGINGFFIFLFTQFMRGIPQELDEAATIDGCHHFQLFARIHVPLSVPAIITASIFAFLWTWNDFFTQMLYLSDIKKFTVALALRMFIDSQGQSSWGALFAMSILSLIPLFVMFIAFQKYLVEGITAGSIKG
ncbi:MAG: carbohydrate ABC transporter permease [Lachnospiraceae bacterium]|jgi:multiple sugar transport system permease protein|nr:carbohydrate ABC transporter permease [Lachnospiraceae bacterium]